MTLDERNITDSLLFFRNLAVKEEIKECKVKKERGCFYYNETLGVQLECPDTDTCPESSK